MRPPLPFEDADSRDARFDSRGMKRAERRGDILGAVAVDLADEAKRQVKLLVALTTRRGESVHRRSQRTEERRVGKEWVRQSRSRWARGNVKKKRTTHKKRM